MKMMKLIDLRTNSVVLMNSANLSAVAANEEDKQTTIATFAMGNHIEQIVVGMTLDQFVDECLDNDYDFKLVDLTTPLVDQEDEPASESVDA